jgi:centriolar protein POC1
MSSSLDSKIKLWDIKKGALDYTLYGHNGSVTTCSFSKYGDYFATGGGDSMMILWKTNL